MNEIQQLSFDYSALPIDVATQARLASERIKMRLRRTAEDIVEIGRELSQIKEVLGHGNFLPWIEKEFEMSNHTAQNFMNVFSKFGKNEIISNLKPTILYLLSAPSTPETVIQHAAEKAESGEKVTVEDVKRWKTEAIKANEKLDLVCKTNEHLQEENAGLQGKIDSLTNQKPEVVEKIVTKEILPPDYETIKAEHQKAKEAVEAAKKTIENLKVKQAKMVDEQFQARLKFHEAELKNLETQKNRKEKELQNIDAELATRNRKLSEVSWHEEMVKKHWGALTELSIDLGDANHNPETSERWRKLATGFLNAAKAIELTMCDGNPIDERIINSLNEETA